MRYEVYLICCLVITLSVAGLWSCYVSLTDPHTLDIDVSGFVAEYITEDLRRRLMIDLDSI